MRVSKWKIFRWFAGIVACINLSVPDSLAQNYPVKPIRLVVGFSTGGINDVVARLIAQKLSEPLGQQVIVENRAGASGMIANERVAKSPPDGYTLLLLGGSSAILPALHVKMTYDLERDLAPVALLAISPFVVVVHPSVPVRNVMELIALAKSSKHELRYATVGLGSPPHLMAELLKTMAKVNILPVPYKGGGDAVVALASGEIDMYISSVPSLLPLRDAGRIRLLAVTSAKRMSALPSLPTIHESGLPGYDYANWTGLVVPAGTPKDLIARLNAELHRIFNNAEVRDMLINKLGMEPETGTPEQFAKYMHEMIEKNARLVKLIGMKAE
ncbi:MAG: tripartite tricarboxylate transporter substrate binding protein [Betaproteobacteria bacterium]|nr:tripartite tricarboxylate transporter substrate binding protein [Betaproteobacteria bacterium]